MSTRLRGGLLRRVGKILIVVPCSGRKRPGGVADLAWSTKESAVAGLSAKGGGRLLAARSELARRFGYRDGEDLGGRSLAPVPLMPACRRYDGNLYRKIDSSHWSALADETRVVIVSALYGLVAPREAIRDYNRTMSDLVAPRMSLARWWSERDLGSLLLEYVQRSRALEVHDFLSGAYARVADALDSLRGQVAICHNHYPSLGSGADHHRGRDVRSLLQGRT